jgi:hypothetical protein
MNIMAIIPQLASGWYGKIILEHVIYDDRRLQQALGSDGQVEERRVKAPFIVHMGAAELRQARRKARPD